MEAVGIGATDTIVTTVSFSHASAAGMVYETVYVPVILNAGMMSPVNESITNPAGSTEYIPPVVPSRVTGCFKVMFMQNGDPWYEISALGAIVMVTCVLAVTTPHPPSVLV